jgi:hypothetical protein
VTGRTLRQAVDERLERVDKPHRRTRLRVAVDESGLTMTDRAVLRVLIELPTGSSWPRRILARRVGTPSDSVQGRRSRVTSNPSAGVVSKEWGDLCTSRVSARTGE